VEDLVLTAMVPGTVKAEWSRAPRANRYRVFSQVLTVDADPVNVATVHDLETLLESLPSGLTLKVFIKAANEAGEANGSEVKTIVIP
jgi:hypothetical protein